MPSKLMRAAVLCAAAPVLFCACATTGGAGHKISSKPKGATVRIEGTNYECLTPCRVEVDRRRSVIVAKAGYVAQRLILSPGGGSTKVRLELAAPTNDVDAVALPDL